MSGGGGSISNPALLHREDTLWSKYNEIKRVLLEKRRPAAAIRQPDRFDDSGRRVDMTEVQQNLFIGSE